ncbi:tail fiber domain-containing protein [Sagittula salina]|uniref:Tail fiber domain-containing protein n=1 Tax=Sagittula salina TaxID=2820268 RepID=A0A940MVF4_9RHOB|nr:tail fiber domain-containing protein [Sagittula salina]MBP0484677.1 tail fiber domain-containing protein [Sagittula salina]
MGGKSSAPKPDPNIGIAAMKSAQTGEDFLAWMKDQSAISNQWASEDRARYKSVFEPQQDAYIARANAGPDYGKVDADVRRATADVGMQFDAMNDQNERQMASMGVNPASGRFASATRSSALAEAAAKTGAANTTRLASRTAAEGKADAMQANAINLGSGLAVNPATSLGLANGAASSGFSGAMSGYGQQGSLLTSQHNSEMRAWQADQDARASTMSGVGSVVGLGISMLSSKEAKTDKKPARGVLETLKSMPVEDWRYKPGQGDGGRHVGPYAEDFHAATGKGDGKTIPVVDAIGVTMGAVQELAKKVEKMEGRTA